MPVEITKKLVGQQADTVTESLKLLKIWTVFDSEHLVESCLLQTGMPQGIGGAVRMVLCSDQFPFAFLDGHSMRAQLILTFLACLFGFALPTAFAEETKFERLHKVYADATAMQLTDFKEHGEILAGKCVHTEERNELISVFAVASVENNSVIGNDYRLWINWLNADEKECIENVEGTLRDLKHFSPLRFDDAKGALVSLRANFAELRYKKTTDQSGSPVIVGEEICLKDDGCQIEKASGQKVTTPKGAIEWLCYLDKRNVSVQPCPPPVNPQPPTISEEWVHPVYGTRWYFPNTPPVTADYPDEICRLRGFRVPTMAELYTLVSMLPEIRQGTTIGGRVGFWSRDICYRYGEGRYYLNIFDGIRHSNCVVGWTPEAYVACVGR